MKASLALSVLTLAAITPGPDYSGFIPATLTLHQKSEYYDRWEKKLPCTSGSLSTRVTLSDLDPGPTYAAGFRMRVITRKQDGAQIDVFEKRNNPLVGRMNAHLASAVDLVDHTLVDSFAAGQSFTVTVTWNGPSVSFSVNGRSAGAVKYNSPADRLQLIAVGSTAKFEENDLECDLTS